MGMPLFQYKAVSADGQLSEGHIEGADRDAVVAQLQRAGKIPIRADPVDGRTEAVRSGQKRRRHSRITRGALLELTRSFASLLQAGIPIDHAFQVLAQTLEHAGLCAIVEDLQTAVRGGATLSAALERHERVFGRLYVSMVRTAETAGTLDRGMLALVDYLERSKQLREQVVSALVYPVILMAVAGVSVLVILMYVVPRFSAVFADFGSALPWGTRVVVGASNGLRDYWVVGVVVFAALAGAAARARRHPQTRRHLDAVMLRLPLFGELIARLQTARFTRSLGMLLQSGVPLLTALLVAKDTATNGVFSDDIQAAAARLKEGQGLSKPLTESGVFPKLALQMIKVGEESGQLEGMLMRVADVYEREVWTATQRLLSVLEPALIIGLGLVIAGIVLSLMMAVMGLNQLPL